MTLKKTLALVFAVLMIVTCFAACKGKDASGTDLSSGTNVDPNATYTYNDYLTASPNTWNPHTQQTNDDSYILGYTTIGLYAFAFNDDRSAYAIVPEMADGEPVDVTAEYAGKEEWGVPAGESKGYAFKIALNQAACWEDGTKINADTYIYSMKALLDPKAQNYRADSYYLGNLSLVNAREYVYQGQDDYLDASGTYTDEELAAADFADKNEVYVKIDSTCVFFGDGSMKDYYDSYGAEYFTVNGEDLITKYAEPTRLTSAMIAELNAVATNFGDTNPTAFIEFCFTKKSYAADLDFSKVGLQKTGEYEITLILTKPVSDFNLHYSLTDTWLVYEPLYTANQKEVEGTVSSTYGTSVDTYLSFGPYKLSEYQTDKVIKLVKNDKWYGYTDGKHQGQYMTTNIVTQIIAEYTTRLEMFQKGELDLVALQKDEMSEYRSSDYIYFTPGDSTWFLLVCSDFDSLKARQDLTPGTNKTILSIKEFREALSLCANRNDFAQTLYPQGSVGLGLFSSLIVYDPENAGIYRNTDAAKATLCNAYGVEYGEGKEYATLEEAYASITGYDLEAARVKFQEAYDIAKKNGWINDTDTVTIEYMEANDTETAQKWYNYIKKMIEDAVVGTDLEGRIKVDGRFNGGNDFASIFMAGQTDMMIAGWTGSAMDPYGLMEAYLSENYRYDQWWDTTKVNLTLKIDGKDVTMDLYSWYRALVGEEVNGYNFGESKADGDTRLEILAALEAAVLEQKDTIPLLYSGSASLASMKIKFGSEEYILGIGRGDLRYMTYNFTDTEWTNYVKTQGGTLTYK